MDGLMLWNDDKTYDSFFLGSIKGKMMDGSLEYRYFVTEVSLLKSGDI